MFNICVSINHRPTYFDKACFLFFINMEYIELAYGTNAYRTNITIEDRTNAYRRI